VCETGTSVPVAQRKTYWAPQSAHTALIDAINVAQDVYDRSDIVQRKHNITVTSGRRYTFPIAVDGSMPSATSFAINFDPEMLVFFGMTENANITLLSPHSPEDGVVVFRYDNPSGGNQPTIILEFGAIDDGGAKILITAFWFDVDVMVANNSVSTAPVDAGQSSTGADIGTMEIIEFEPLFILDKDGNYVPNPNRQPQEPRSSFGSQDALSLEEQIRLNELMMEHFGRPSVFNMPSASRSLYPMNPSIRIDLNNIGVPNINGE
jgi:hypothetical protein